MNRDAAGYADRPCRAELAAAVVTGLGHVALEIGADGMRGAAGSLDRPQHLYNAAAAVAWGLYLVWRLCRTPGAAAAWGFRRAGFRWSLKASLLFALAAAVPLLAWGAARGRLPLPLSFWLVLGLYPVYGLAQQFVLQALVTRNLRECVPRRAWRVAASSALFSAAHFPNYWLMALTLGAGLGFTAVYERGRNIWAVGLVHGILGALAYDLVLGEDPGASLLGLLGLACREACARGCGC